MHFNNFGAYLHSLNLFVLIERFNSLFLKEVFLHFICIYIYIPKKIEKII